MSVHLPYATYRDSGIDWLGRIPAHWSLIRLARTVTSCQNGVWGDEPSGGDTDMICVRVADFDRVRYRIDLSSPTYRSIPLRQRADRQLMQHDLLLEKSGGGETQPVGAVMLYDHDQPAVCSNFVARMPVREGFSPNFLCYLHATLYASRINTRSIKQSIGIQNLDSAAYLQELVTIPTLPEQHAIADFLDRETARIDALIAKKQRLIELLHEKRTALISHAVTKGLDAGVAMKESGVAWLGQVPAHWRTARIRDVALSLQTGPFGSQLHADEYITDGIPIINPAHLNSGRIQPDRDCTVDQATWLRLARHELLEGDIIFARRGEMGRCALVTTTEQGWLCGSGSLRLRPSRDMVDPVFLSWMLSTTGVAEWLSLESVGTTMDNLSAKIIGQVPLPIPPLSEQRAIADRVILETERMIGLSGKIDTAIEKLREYRTALISAAVTGKIDVRA